MYTHTKFDHAFDYRDKPRLGYFICSTPRCGSSLLCEALCLSGVAGVPTEYFDENTKAGFISAWCIDEVDYLPNLLIRKTTPNGVFGCKAHFHQYHDRFGTDRFPTFCKNMKYIWLSRRDIVRQAISYSKAVQTNQWASTHTCQNPKPTFDYDQIEKYRQQIEYEERMWNRFFVSHGIEPFHIHYEDFCDNLPLVTSTVLLALGVESRHLPDESGLTLQKQSDAVNENWLERYLAQQS